MIKNDFPYVAQREIYYCGPAVLQMILAKYGRGITQEEIAKIAGTTETGTPPTKLVSTAEALGLHTRVIEPATVEQLKNIIDKGLPVVVDFTEPETNWKGHYAIASGYDDNYLYLHDSDADTGPDTKFTWEDFAGRWHDHDDGGNPTNHWLAIFSDQSLPADFLATP